MYECKCGKFISGERRKIFFKYNGYKFKIIFFTTCKGCAKRIFIENFELFRSGLIKGKKMIGGVTIDWTFYHFQNNQDKLKLDNILISMGILSYKSLGCWEIADGSLIIKINPCSLCLRFIRKKDAIEYSKIINKGRPSLCEIRKISKVIMPGNY